MDPTKEQLDVWNAVHALAKRTMPGLHIASNGLEPIIRVADDESPVYMVVMEVVQSVEDLSTERKVWLSAEVRRLHNEY